MIKDLARQVTGAQEEDFRRSKNLPIFKCTSGGIQGSKLGEFGGLKSKEEEFSGPYRRWYIHPTVNNMQEHQGVVTRDKAKQLKSHKDQIEQENFQGLNFNVNFDVQDFMGQYPKFFNKLEIENSPWLMSGSPFVQAEKLSPIFGNVFTSALE
ncbi:hypothetical protein M9H77_17749 [Catharanthus roseus]|uniref:Uncharacterized protein n=1 Tax=Catharanthus roseus TaxID=4058 RepID=A0ACC0B5I4_CATRO|nr:hypothetical protein M9H77_17749 [Catharanthus roseus]